MSITVSRIMKNMRHCFGTHKQSDRTFISLSEMCMSVLRSKLPSPKTALAVSTFTSLRLTSSPSTSPRSTSTQQHPMNPPSTPTGRGRLSRSKSSPSSSPHTSATTTTARHKPTPEQAHGVAIGVTGKHNLHSNTILFLCDLFRNNVSQRGFVIQECFSFVSLNYSLPKSFPKVHRLPLLSEDESELSPPIAHGGTNDWTRHAHTSSMHTAPLVTSAVALVTSLAHCVSGSQQQSELDNPQPSGASKPPSPSSSQSVGTTVTSGESGSGSGSGVSSSMSAQEELNSLQIAFLSESGTIAASIVSGLLKVIRGICQ